MTSPPTLSAEELIQRHQRLVRSIASTLSLSLPKQVEYDDLVSYGQVGLAEAARDYQPDRGVVFSTYAYHRIRGAIYDGATKLGWYSRAHAKRLRFQRAAQQALRDKQTNESPDSAEPVAKACQTVAQLAVVGLALEAGDDSSWTDQIEDNKNRSGAAEAEWAEMKVCVRDAVATLPSDAANLISRVYFHGQTLAEASREAGRDKSWGSRTHARALQSLARILGEHPHGPAT